MVESPKWQARARPPSRPDEPPGRSRCEAISDDRRHKEVAMQHPLLLSTGEFAQMCNVSR